MWYERINMHGSSWEFHAIFFKENAICCFTILQTKEFYKKLGEYPIEPQISTIKLSMGTSIKIYSCRYRTDATCETGTVHSSGAPELTTGF